MIIYWYIINILLIINFWYIDNIVKRIKLLIQETTISIFFYLEILLKYIKILLVINYNKNRFYWKSILKSTLATSTYIIDILMFFLNIFKIKTQ